MKGKERGREKKRERERERERIEMQAVYILSAVLNVNNNAVTAITRTRNEEERPSKELRPSA
jgi:hypothetical protein